jgi:hypothetical protein
LATYSGFYRPSKKYAGVKDKITYRSLWELSTFRWLDKNPKVIKWLSEEVEIVYECKTDNKIHVYYPDLKIWYENKVLIVEIKPKNQVKEPKMGKRKTRRYLTEVMTYIKNTSKWEAAREYCKDRNYIFEIWTEDILKNLGVKIL